MSKEFKICIIGCGYMTNDGHGPSCKKYAAQHEDVRLSACCDLNIEAARTACEKFGFERAYTDYTEMIEIEKPDVALVITPTAVTAEVAIGVLKKNVPALIEKPPGMNQEQIKMIHETALLHQTPARAAFNRRYMPLVTALAESIKEANSKILDINCMFIRVGRTDDDFSTTAIHGIDTVKYLSGSEYKSARFLYNDMDYNGKNITNISIMAEMVDGVSASMSFLPCGGCVAERISITLKDHTFFLQMPVWGGVDAPGKLVCMKEGKVYKTVSGDELVSEQTVYETNGFYTENADFFDMLRSGKRPVSDIIGATSSVLIAECIRKRKELYM